MRPLSHVTTLRELSLSDNHIGADGARMLAQPLGKFTALTALGLRDNNFGFDGTRALAQHLSRLTALKDVRLDGNNIDADGARVLAQLGLQVEPSRVERPERNSLFRNVPDFVADTGIRPTDSPSAPSPR